MNGRVAATPNYLKYLITPKVEFPQFIFSSKYKLNLGFEPTHKNELSGQNIFFSRFVGISMHNFYEKSNFQYFDENWCVAVFGDDNY